MRIWTTAVAAAAIAVATAGAAHAAPESDATFFDFLQSHGVSTDQPELLKNTAGEICRQFDDGASFAEVGVALMERGADPHQATIQIFGAVDSYCPANAGQLNVAPTPPTRLV